MYEFPSPLGEMGLSIYRRRGTTQLRESRFRPLSGKWGYRFRTAITRAKGPLFQVSVPSRGNGVIDLDENGKAKDWDIIGFPSPLGEMGLSISRNNTSERGIYHRFPSPLGEMGLSIREGHDNGHFHLLVSVPSRGNGVIDSAPSLRLPHGRTVWFPSPLGEMGLSIALTMRSRRDNSRIHSMY